MFAAETAPARDDERVACDLPEDAAKLRTILDTTVDGILTINEEATVLSYDKAAERIFGYSANEVVGHNVNMLMPFVEEEKSISMPVCLCS